MPDDCLPYRRARFSTRLPADRVYTPAHFWLLEIEPGVWRIGFTQFATRMLGDLVEHAFNVKPGNRVEVGQQIGWVEGFKALTDIYSVAVGQFEGSNPELEKDITLTDTDPYGQGWLYSIRGEPDANRLDAKGYTELLDLTIDKMLGQ